MPTPRDDLEVGAVAPDFTLEDSEGAISLADFRDRQPVVLFFMRELTCPVGQRHVARLRQLYDRLHAAKMAVLVIGGGSCEDAIRLQQRLQLPFPVLADPERAVFGRYGLDKVLHVIQRSGTVLVDAQGVIRHLHRVTLPAEALDEAALLAVLAPEPAAAQPALT